MCKNKHQVFLQRMLLLHNPPCPAPHKLRKQLLARKPFVTGMYLNSVITTMLNDQPSSINQGSHSTLLPQELRKRLLARKHFVPWGQQKPFVSPLAGSMPPPATSAPAKPPPPVVRAACICLYMYMYDLGWPESVFSAVLVQYVQSIRSVPTGNMMVWASTYESGQLYACMTLRLCLCCAVGGCK